MEELTEFMNWAELFPDVLGLIFSHLCLQERLTIVSRVCKSWNQVVLGPYCWQTIDIVEWSYWSNPDHIDPILRLLVNRSSGALRELSVSYIQNDLTFAFLADNAQSLRSLQIHRSNISDSIMEQLAVKLSGVTCMDLSYCCKIGPRCLTAIGKNCKSLVRFRRNMHPMDVNERRQDEEAAAIAATMPKLKHLEMTYNSIDTESVVKIIESCPELEFLDLRGCWYVDLNLDLPDWPNWRWDWLQKWAPKIKVLGPHVEDLFEVDDWFSGSDYSVVDSMYSNESSDEWDDDDDDVDLHVASSFELSLYEQFDEIEDNGWPLSP